MCCYWWMKDALLSHLEYRNDQHSRFLTGMYKTGITRPDKTLQNSLIDLLIELFYLYVSLSHR